MMRIYERDIKKNILHYLNDMGKTPDEFGYSQKLTIGICPECNRFGTIVLTIDYEYVDKRRQYYPCLMCTSCGQTFSVNSPLNKVDQPKE